METSIDSASDARLQALKSLHLMMQEKDQTTQIYKEKAQRYEKALQQAENRIAKLMQLHAGAAAATATSVQEGGAAASSSIPLLHTSHPASESSSSSSSNSTNVTPMHSSSRENTLIAGQSSSAMRTSDRMGQLTGRLVTDGGSTAQAVENVSHKELTEGQLIPRGLPGRPVAKGQSRTTFNSNDLETDGDGPVRPARAGQQAGAGMLPGVSRVLFDNAVKENVKLKKMLQEILQKDGSNVKVFLERQEYADVIKQLRAELVTKQQKIEELQSWIAMQKAGQSQQLLVQMLEMQNRVQHLNKEGQVKSAMVDNCLKENDKLRSENETLKSKQSGNDQAAVNQLTQTIGGLKKQLEEEREKHHLHIKKLMESTQKSSQSDAPDNDLDSLRVKVNQLEGQLKDEAESKQLQKEQILSYEDDYRAVQNELKQLKEKNDKEIGILQGQIKNLQRDKQRVERDYIAEKQKSQNLEGLIVKFAPQYLKATGGIPAPTCAQQIREPWMSGASNQPQSILVQDGLPSKPKKSGTLKTDGGVSKTTSGDRAKGAAPVARSRSTTEGKFTCPRCYKTDFNSVEHFEDHFSKCANT